MFNAAVKQLDAEERLGQPGIEPVMEGPRQFAGYAAKYVARNAEVLMAAKVEPGYSRPGPKHSGAVWSGRRAIDSLDISLPRMLCATAATSVLHAPSQNNGRCVPRNSVRKTDGGRS
jgi:hypothetical protein